MRITHNILLYTVLLSLTMATTACSSVDFEPHRKYKYLGDTSHVPDTHNSKPIGHMYIGSNKVTSDNEPMLVELTRKRAKYQASTPLYKGIGKSSDVMLSVNRGNEFQTGLKFSFDLDLFK